VLTNLLPGLRDLRAPLSAGFIWLFGIWLLAWPDVNDSDSELVKSVLALKDAVSPAGVGAALAFVAYLLGSASESVLGGAVGLALRVWPDARRAVLMSGASEAAIEEVAVDAAWESSRRLRARDINERAAFGTLSFTDVVESVARSRDQLNADFERALAQGEHRRARALDEWERGVSELLPVNAAEHIRAWFLSRPEDEDWFYIPVGVRLKPVLEREMDQMRTRLLVDQPGLFSKVDRLRAEAEFRGAIALPLAFLACVVAFDTEEWWIGVAILALVVPLLTQALRRSRESTDALMEALRTGKVGSPTLDRVRALGTDQWVKDVWGPDGPPQASSPRR
jgi:hypothetical protein